MRALLLTAAALACATPALAQSPPGTPPADEPVNTSAPATPAMPATPPIPNPRTANDPVAPALPADPSYKGPPYKGALTPPPPEAMNKKYSVCRGAIQDSCINPSAARED